MKSWSLLVAIVCLIGCSDREKGEGAVNFSNVVVIGDRPESVKDHLVDRLTDFSDVRVNVAGAPQIVVHATIVSDSNHSSASLTANTSDGITAMGYEEAGTTFSTAEVINASAFELAAGLRNQALERLTAPSQVGKENTPRK